MEEYPREVRAPPLLLAALAGANHLHPKLTEALHESAVTACGQKRVRYLSHDYSLTVPPCKRGGQETPGYIVEGILKRRWLEKVCNEIPAVLVVCFDWSTELTPTLAEEAQALTHLQHARKQIQSREIRLLVFAVVHGDNRDPDAACNLVRQQPDIIGLITVLGHADMSAKANRLERLVYQHAMTFYADEEKRHRRQRLPSPSAPQWMTNALSVRANIKIGYTCELRRDTRGALKSYIKAYEQLIHDTEIADVVERIGLCNHITLRMYQLYLQSHDIGLAVHHCGIHTMTLRSCSAGDRDSVGSAALAWRKWHWLAANHQLFAELLESVVQQLPLLIDQNDMWQFPGFHYQSAAAYVTRLKHWAATVGENAPLPSGVGGEMLPSFFLGQAGKLERPNDMPDSGTAEVAARCAHTEVQQASTGDRGLQLLIRAHAASKERDYKARTLVCMARMADEYLGEGNLPAAAKLYERLRLPSAPPEVTDPKQPASRPWTVWPGIRRFALQRAISCSCRELKLKEPSLCAHGCSRPPAAGAPSVDDHAAAERPEADGSTSDPVVQAEEEVVAAREEAARRRLLSDAFEYLSLAESASQTESTSVVKVHESELLEVVEGALGGLSPGLEVAFGAASARVSFVRAGGAEAEVTGLTVSLHSSLSVPLKVSGVVALTSRGDVELQALIDTWPQSWQEGQDLELHGSWQAIDAALPPEVSVSAIRVAWASASGPGCSLLIRDVQARPTGDQAASPMVPAFQLPCVASLGSQRLGGGGPAGGALNTETAVRSQPAATPFRSKAFFPVDPATAIMGERFLFHVLIIRERGHSLADSPTRSLSLACTARVEEASEDGGEHSGEIRISLVSRTADGAAMTDWVETALLPDARSPAELVAELPGGSDGLRPAGTVLSLASESLADGPSLCSDNEDMLVVPVMVSCDRNCKATLSFSVDCASSTGSSGARRVAGPQVSLTFRPAMQVAFEDKAFEASGPGKSAGALRKISLRCLASAPLDILRVFAQPDDRPALGVPGRVAPQSQHVFALPPGANGSMLVIQFHRAAAVSSFFPWPQSHLALPQAPLPAGVSEWPLPSEPPKPAAAAMGSLKVELRHCATGVVAESIEVKVSVRRTTQSIQELRVRVQQDPDHIDRFFIGGPTSTQAVLVSASNLDLQVCSTFTLVPLKPGWLQLPRVQVSTANQEVASTPSSIFVFPSTQPTLWRGSA